MAGEQILVIDDSPTILKVVQLVLSKAGYVVRTASDGEEGVRAAQEGPPDVILLDFVMPRMNGYQVCRALAASPELRGVPVVLMSAKGDQIGERFVKVMGIVDYITKPFSPDAITAVVDHTLAKYGRRSATGQDRQASDGTGASTPREMATPALLRPVPAREPAPPGDGEATPHPASDGVAETTAPRLNERARRRERMLEMLRDALVAAVGDDEGGRLRLKLSDEALEEALRSLGPFVAVGEPDAVLSGDLLAVPLVEVLSLLQQQQQTGVLIVGSPAAPPAAEESVDPAAVAPPVRVQIHFRDGKVDFAGATGLGEEFLLGRYLTAQESISRQDLDLFLQSRSSTSRLIGEQLVKLSYVNAVDLRRALARQSCEVIYEVLRWAAGSFAFRATSDLGPLAEGAALGLSVDAILMEGVRRVDEWHLIEREIDDFEAVFLRNEEAVREVGRAALTREELAVLELVSGKNNVRDIVRQARMSSFDVSKMLFRLRSIKLIRKRVGAVAV